MSREQYPWPRVWYNFPIIMCGIAVQLIWCVALILDISAENITKIHLLLEYTGQSEVLVVFVLFITAALAFCSFFIRRKLYALLVLVPQQFILVSASGSVVHSIIEGQFADGVVRTHAFLLADQSPMIAFTFFHSWAMILIMLHGEDRSS